MRTGSEQLAERRPMGALPYAGRVLVVSVLTCLGTTAPAENEDARHPDVEAALAWALPESGCAPPDSFTSLGGKTAQTDVIRHQNSNTSAGMFGVDVAGGGDSAAIRREQRRQERWHVCMRAYKQRLVDDFGVLRASFDRPMTRNDAEAIATKLRLIQDIVMSPSGEVPDSQ